MNNDGIIMVALNIVGVLMELITLWYLCKIILGENIKNLKQTVLVFGCTGVLLLGVSLIGTVAWQRMTGYFFILLIPMMLYDGHILLKIFVSVLFLVISGGSEILTKALFIALNGNFAAFEIHNTWGKFAQGLIISKFLAFVIVRVMASLQKVQRHQLSSASVLALSILPITTVLAVNQLIQSSYIIDRQEVYAITFMIVALLVISNIVLFYIFESQAENEQTKLRLALLQRQQNAQEKFYSQLAEEKLKTNRLAHDWSKYLLAMSGYLREGRYEEVLDCLKNLDVNLQEAVCHFTSDMAVDTVIAEKAQLAKDQATAFNVTSFIQAPLLADGVDLAVILANALDNAMEATSGVSGSEIGLKLVIDEDYIDIIIRNTLSHEVKIVNNTIATTKADKAMHGLGLISIQEIVDHYDGDLELKMEEGLFVFDVMLMNETK